MFVEADNQSALSFIFNLFVRFPSHSLTLTPFFLSYIGPIVYTIISGHTAYCTLTHEYVDSYSRSSISFFLFPSLVSFCLLRRLHSWKLCGFIPQHTHIHTARKQYPHSTILSSNHLISDYHKLCVHENGRLKSNLSRMVCVCWKLRSCIQSRGCELKIENFIHQMKRDPSCEVEQRKKKTPSTTVNFSVRLQKCVKWTRKEENGERYSRSRTSIFKILTDENACMCVCVNARFIFLFTFRCKII